MSSGRRVQPSFSTQALEDQQQSGRSYLRRHNLVKVLGTSYSRVALIWHTVQIGNRGHYSVERVLAFRDYCERSSRSRALAVCVLTPVPAALVMLLIECIPLRRPNEGWKANKLMFVRVLASAIFVGGGIVFLAKTVIDEGKISTARAISITIVSAFCYTGLAVLLAATWRFPIPFGVVLMVCPFVTIIMILVLASIDTRALKTNKRLQKQVMGHILGASAQSLLVVAYPTFNAVYLQLSGVEQAFFMLLLPVIKFITKQIIARVANHLQDHIGVVIVFSVDVFNVLYVAICMQTARSWLTTLMIISSDFVHILLALRSIYYHTKIIQGQNNIDQGGRNYIHKLLLCMSKFQPRTRPYDGSIHLFGPYRLPLSTASQGFLDVLDDNWNDPAAVPSPLPQSQELATQASVLSILPAITVGPSCQLVPPYPPQPPGSIKIKGSRSCQQLGIKLIGRRVPAEIIIPHTHFLPRTSLSERAKRSVPTLSNSQSSTRRTVGVGRSRMKVEKTIDDGLQVLFHCEYVILSEYIECMLPLMYAGYLAGLYHLPTAAYYPFTRSLTPAKMTSTLVQLVIYGSIEVLSLSGLEVMLKKRLGFSPVYLLAFVLETQAVLVQSMLFIWIPFIVQLTFDHGGKPFYEQSAVVRIVVDLLAMIFAGAGVDFNAPFQ